MDTLFGLGSFMKDVIDTKDDIKKMLEKLTILLSRFQRLFNQAVFDESQQKVRIFSSIRTKQIVTNLSQTKSREYESVILFQCSKHQITLNLPFVDKTKTNIKQTIEDLEKAITELKQMKQKSEVKQKRNIHYLTASKKNKQDKQEPMPCTLTQSPNPIFSATLEDKNCDEDNISVQITLKMNYPKQLVQNDKTGSFQFMKKFNLTEDTETETIFSFTRNYFKSTYETAKKLIPQIDFISSKNKHFQIILYHQIPSKQSAQQQGDQTSDDSHLCEPISALKKCKASQHSNKQQPKSSQKEKKSQDQFNSFPVSNELKCININEFKLNIRNLSKLGTYIRRQGTKQWKLIDGDTALGDGDQISPILSKPDKINAAFSLQVGFKLALQ